MNPIRLFASIAAAVTVVGAAGMAYAEILQESSPSRQAGKDIESTGTMRPRAPRVVAPAPAPSAAATPVYDNAVSGPTGAPGAVSNPPAASPPMASEPMARADRN